MTQPAIPLDEFVRIAGREPTDLERRVNGYPKAGPVVTACACTGEPKSILDEAGMPVVVDGGAVCPHCGRNPFGVDVLAELGLNEMPDSEGGD
jgi:hypothetical protein